VKSTGKSAATLFLPKVAPKKPKAETPVVSTIPSKDYGLLVTKSPKTKIKRILVSHPAPEGLRSPYYDIEKKFGVKFHFQPFIEVQGITTKEFRKQRISLTDFSGVVFTSRNSIDHFFRMCDELRVKMSQETKFFCTSEAIALYLQKYTQYRKRKVFYSDQNNNKELKNLMLKHKDSTKFLYICPEVRSKEELTTFMKENQIDFVEAVMYKTVPLDLSSLNLNNYDMLVLFSPTGLIALFHNFPKFKQDKLQIAVYGKSTADAVLEAKLSIHVMAPLGDVLSINVALDKHLQ
jgi:uroporphyrinogen-III synthase